MEISCFVLNEKGEQESSWPARHPTEELLASKEAYRVRGMLSSFLREKEVTVINSEEAPFSKDTLIKHTDYNGFLFEKLCISIDPASSDTKKADFQAVVLQALLKKQVYLINQALTKGEDVESSADAIFKLVVLCRNFFGLNPEVVCERTGYQRVLAKFIVSQQATRGIFFTVLTVDDKRKKEDRIIQALAPVSNAGCYHVLSNNVKFQEDFETYPNVKHDDLLDAVAVGIDHLIGIGSTDIVSIGRERPTVATYALAAQNSKRRISPTRLIRHG